MEQTTDEFEWLRITEEDKELYKLINGIDMLYTPNDIVPGCCIENTYVSTIIDDGWVERWVNHETEHSVGNIIAYFVDHYKDKGHTDDAIINLWDRYMRYLKDVIDLHGVIPI